MDNTFDEEYIVYMFLKVEILLIVLLLPTIVAAHPGNTASDGCHYSLHESVAGIGAKETRETRLRGLELSATIRHAINRIIIGYSTPHLTPGSYPPDAKEGLELAKL